MLKHFNIKVTGKVQGVGFRYATRDMALAFGVKGFVQNLSDGNVYIEAEAEEEVLNDLILWCKKGPQLARVNNVFVTPSVHIGFTSFYIKH
jgi:acylphosphatase